MGSVYYYSSYEKNIDPTINTTINKCSVSSDARPISVNCVGRFVTEFPFTTDNPEGRNDYYLLYMVRGEMDLRAGGAEAHATSGGLFLIPPHTHYTYTYGGGEPLDYLWAHFTGSYAEELLRECGMYPLPYFGVSEDGGRISERFRRMFEIFELRAPLREQRAAACLQEILLDAAESIAKREENPIELSLRYIHSSYDKKLSIPALAAMENLSNSRYIALFNRYTGMSPSAYIIELRMNTAKELLHTTDMSVKQVGMLVGYSDAHFFSKLFKKRVGVSPNEYRAVTAETLGNGES